MASPDATSRAASSRDASPGPTPDGALATGPRTCAQLSAPIAWPDGVGMLCADRDDGTVSRLDLHTDRVLWRVARPSCVTWAPFVATPSQIVLSGTGADGSVAMALDPADGTVRWRRRYEIVSGIFAAADGAALSFPEAWGIRGADPESGAPVGPAYGVRRRMIPRDNRPSTPGSYAVVVGLATVGTPPARGVVVAHADPDGSPLIVDAHAVNAPVGAVPVWSTNLAAMHRGANLFEAVLFDAGRAFFRLGVGDDERVTALELSTGRVLWTHPLGPMRCPMGSGAESHDRLHKVETAADASLLAVGCGFAESISLSDGRTRWRRQLRPGTIAAVVGDRRTQPIDFFGPRTSLQWFSDDGSPQRSVTLPTAHVSTLEDGLLVERLVNGALEVSRLDLRGARLWGRARVDDATYRGGVVAVVLAGERVHLDPRDGSELRRVRAEGSLLEPLARRP